MDLSLINLTDVCAVSCRAVSDVCAWFSVFFNDTIMENSIMALVPVQSRCIWPSFRSPLSRTQWHRAIGDSYRSTGAVMSSVSEQTGLSDIVYSPLPPSFLTPPFIWLPLVLSPPKTFVLLWLIIQALADTKPWGLMERKEKRVQGPSEGKQQRQKTGTIKAREGNQEVDE